MYVFPLVMNAFDCLSLKVTWLKQHPVWCGVWDWDWQRTFTKQLLSGPVAQWITRLTTDQKIPGSNPGKVDFFEEDGNIFC